MKKVDVLYDAGPVDQSWSVAQLEYKGSPAVGIRWNGDENNNIGTPQARGNPVWFVLPRELERAVRDAVQSTKQARENALANGYQMMAADRERELEADEWTEALVGEID